jgi:hypothetical protein
VVPWQQAGFLLYWRLISNVKKAIGRRQTPKEVRQAEESVAIRAARFASEADFPFRAVCGKNTAEEFRKVEKNEGALREQ